jgi:hypothetical protein
VRTSGNNNASATSLKFYSNDGKEQMSAASDEYKEIITGSNAGGYVVTADESVLIFNDGDMRFLVFDITWEGDKPVLALRYTIKHGISTIRQMNWDYAGNIVCSGDAGIYVVSLPKAREDNKILVPARKALTVTHHDAGTVGIEDVQLNLNAPMYDVLGRIVDENYKGIVIQNGVSFLRY